MTVTYFLVVVLLFSTTLNASEDSIPCNVERGNKSPLFAKNCTDLGDNLFLVIPCSSNLDACKANRAKIADGDGCGSKSPSTPTPTESVSTIMQKAALKSRVNLVDLSNGDMRSVIELKNDQKYFIKLNKKKFVSGDFAHSLKISGDKQSSATMRVAVSNEIKPTLGWLAFRVEKSQIEAIPINSIIPDCQ